MLILPLQIHILVAYLKIFVRTEAFSNETNSKISWEIKILPVEEVVDFYISFKIGTALTLLEHISIIGTSLLM